MSEIVLSKESRSELRDFSAEQFKTRTLSSEITNESVAYAIACIGAELGLSPLQSLRGIYMVKGKPILAAQTIQAIVVRRREVCEYLMLVESTREKATYETKRIGDPRPTTLTYTIEDAKHAGLLSNQVWKHTSAMLRNRCVAALCRAVYPDLALGLYEESEGEEIRGDSVGSQRVSQETAAKMVHTTGEPWSIQQPERRFSVVEPAQLPAAEPHPAFAPLPNEPSELDSTLIGQIAAAVAEINAISTLDALKAHAAVLKANPLAKEGSASRQTLLDAYTARKQQLTEYAAVLSEAQKPDADKAALTQRAQALTGLSEAQEQAIAKALGQ